MNIREQLQIEHSKAQTEKVAAYVGNDAAKFAELMKCFLGATPRISQRAGWPVSVCVERHPQLADPYFRQFIDQAERTDAHIAVRRNTVRLLQFVDVPKRYRGRIFDLCFRLFADVSETVAVRSDAMTVAAKLADGDEGLLDEMRLIARAHPDKATAGFRSRSRRVLGV